MSKIQCPKCGTIFDVDENDYAAIVKQVRDAEFNQDLADRVHLLEQDKQNALALAEEKSKNELERKLAAKDAPDRGYENRDSTKSSRGQC